MSDYKLWLSSTLATCAVVAVAFVGSLIYLDQETTEEVIAQEEIAEEEQVLVDSKEHLCLARAIYFEARNQSEKGRQAVAAVVLNRVRVGAYPNTICQVVEAGCNFSYNCQKKFKYDPASHPNVLEKKAWDEALELAKSSIIEYNYDSFKDVTHGATFFHTTHVRPKWMKSKELEKTIKIDSHVFYRVKYNGQ